MPLAWYQGAYQIPNVNLIRVISWLRKSTLAIPYAKWGYTEGKKGAGYARNRGAEMARGKFLLFLDADDFFNPG